MWQMLAIGAVAAGSVFLGMPLARSPRVSPRLREGVTSATVGILLFLCVALLSEGNRQVVDRTPFGNFQVMMAAATLAAGFVVGFAALPLTAVLVARRPAAPRTDIPRAPESVGITAAAAMAPFQLSLLAAVGIGLHNFVEGVAIGSTYAAGVVTLSLLLAVGVIAHKSVEGFCICGCASTSSRTFSRWQLGLLGVIGGGPTLVGVELGGVFGSLASASTFVFGLAGGALISVVFLLYDSQFRDAPRSRLSAGLVVGFLLALLTDLALTLGGL